ncbi:TPA: hypothetical protein NJU08_001221 [Acinetobacter baumannii]|uniref:hypothetical protein n=1 Tax=Acinetobacter baumannii TaxID=470 RepID=UPI000B4473AB|nr:hypothetical protein [Acinetobacter baumannii]EHU1482442.1 hypothetical protein [Acinetobacter baumannii]EHU2702754.1 hypothetical protein [Acinetobacter baumannii]OTN19863.1 hypothetical protein B9Y16_12735 [Acinetobacter baumannii]HCG3323604.1 hypothetical protein [Acinetobacter baumannii]
MHSYVQNSPAGKVTTVVLDNFELNKIIVEAVAKELGISLQDTIHCFLNEKCFDTLDLSEYTTIAACLRFLERANAHD